MTEVQESLNQVAQSLRPKGLEEVEVYLKGGRSRRAALGSQGRLVSVHDECGWAVRASGEKRSLFCCGNGKPPRAGPWPAPGGHAIRLPSPRPTPDWREPAEFRTPLCVEHEAFELLEACGRELARELPEARLLQATLEDGESRSRLASTRGVEAVWRQRTATLFLEAALGEEEVIEYSGGRNARAFSPRALARRLADRLLIRRDGGMGERERGTVLLAPPVAVRILAGLLPVLLGERANPAWTGRVVGSENLNVTDDGRLVEGLFAASVDGEGMPTGTKVLIEKGTLRRTLGAGGSADAVPDDHVGCVRRSSYLDVPRIGPSHLYIEADRKQAAGDLLADLSRGHYFLEADAGRFDFEGDRFELTVAGFAVRSGRPTAAVSGARLSGKFSQLLKGLDAVSRDLTFFPMGGLLGSPSLLITGLDINGSRLF